MKYTKNNLPIEQVTVNGAKFRLKPIFNEKGFLRYTIVKVYNPTTEEFEEQFDERLLDDLNNQPGLKMYKPFKQWQI